MRRELGLLVLDLGPHEPSLADGVGLALVLVKLVLGRERALVEVVEEVDFLVVAEEPLVGAEGGGVVAEPLPDALAQADRLLDLLVRDQVDEDLVGLLADAVDTAGALDDPDDRPRQVVVDDDVGVLEVLALGQDVGGDQDVDRVRRPACVRLPRRAGGCSRARSGGRWRLGRRSRRYASPTFGDAGVLQRLRDVLGGVGVLGEDEHLLARVVVAEQVDEGVDLGVLG